MLQHSATVAVLANRITDKTGLARYFQTERVESFLEEPFSMNDRTKLPPPAAYRRSFKGDALAVVAFAVTLFCSLSGSTSRPAWAQSSDSASDSSKAIAAGEFSLAKTLAPESLPGGRDGWLAQVAAAQSLSGDTVGATQTVRQIESFEARQSYLDRVCVLGQCGEAEGAGGGGAFADFDSLMTLIETTVVPDTWEALGGNSTMAPYPQGVYVDPQGTVEVSQTPGDGDLLSQGSLENLQSLLLSPDSVSADDWRSASTMRCVSLRRLRDAISARRIAALPLGDSLLNMGGLSSVQYVMLTDDDIVLAGPVGGIMSDRGWFVDRATGQTTLRSDFLARCFVSSFSNTPFGCTIDPTPGGMQAAMKVAAEIQSGDVPIGESAAQLRDALGMQRVEVFGAAGDTAVALLMVEADRHMKQLALGEQPMPDGVKNYLDMVDELIDQGPPNGMLLRLWFTANPQSVRSDEARRVFEISGDAIRLSGENQRALADGRRGHVAVDPRSVKFVEEFNQNWGAIRDKYPIYGSLASLYRTAAVAHLVNRFGSLQVHHPLAMSLAAEDEAQDWTLVAPRQVASIATLHTVRRAGKRHHVLLASGGVSVEVAQSVDQGVPTYATLAGYASSADDHRPQRLDRWWWDVR